MVFVCNEDCVSLFSSCDTLSICSCVVVVIGIVDVDVDVVVVVVVVVFFSFLFLFRGSDTTTCPRGHAAFLFLPAMPEAFVEIIPGANFRMLLVLFFCFLVTSLQPLFII